MRNPNRLYDFYKEIQRIHITYFPDWRFGQFCSNLFAWMSNEKYIDCFYPEESEMINYIEEFVDFYNKKV